MTTMKERIGKAIVKDLTDRRGIRQALDSIDVKVMAELIESIADAALKELREPTSAMLKRGSLVYERSRGALVQDGLEEVFKAMIDEARK